MEDDGLIRELDQLRNRVARLEARVGRQRDEILLPAPGCRLMFVTEPVTALSGENPGTGKAVEAAYDGGADPPTLTEGDGGEVTVRNAHDQDFAEGEIVSVFTWSSENWVFGSAGGILYGVAAATIGAGGTGTVTLQGGAGGTVTARLKFSGSVTTGVKVYVARVNGEWHIISADCI